MILRLLVLWGIALVNLFFAFFVLQKNRRSEVNRLFAVLSFLLAVWSVTNSGFLITTGKDQIFWASLSYGAGVGILTALLHFSVVFPTRTKGQLQRLCREVAWVATFLVAALTLTPTVTETLAALRDNTPVSVGISLYVIGLYPILVYGLAFYNYWQSYLKNEGKKKRQVKFFWIGASLAVLAGTIFNLIIPLSGNYNYVWLGPVSTLIFITTVLYTIIAHGLFDIRIIIRRTIIYTALLGFIFGVYSLIISFSTALFQPDYNRQSIIINLIAVVIIGFSLDPLRRWFQDKTDQFLFKKEYEQQTVLKELGQRLNNVIALDEALEIVMQTIVKVLHLQHAATYVFQQSENSSVAVKRIKQIGYSSANKLVMDEKDLTIQYFSHNPGILIVEELEHDLEEEEVKITKKANRTNEEDAAFIRQHAVRSSVLKKLRSLEVAVAVPLIINNQPIGLILLSGKLSQEDFNREDLNLIDLVGAQAISSIQKAKLYEGDQMKTEFVSIASHELLTPISAIEGYLSMILDENIGHIDDQTRDYLNKVYASAKRLSLLIKDLLSVSRIEADRMKIEPQSLDISKMITDTIDQLKFVAQEKKIELIYNKPTKELPHVWADPDRTMQVLVNLVSNSIKYTHQGSVSISATVANTGFMAVEIVDTGIGMSKEQQSHLFEKFYRVDSPDTAGVIGTGLGLYITKSILEKMGGSINLKSTPGAGTTFKFTLPLFKVELSKI